MKKLMLAALTGLAMGVGGVTTAQAFTVDTFLFSADLGNSGDATEQAALESFLGLNPGDLTLDLKVETPAPASVAFSNGPGEWYIDVAPREPGYFLLKFGTGNLTIDTHYYFENIAELTKLVWSNDQVNSLTGGDCGFNNQNACNIGRLSHYVMFDGGGGGQDVPEPGTLALLGVALAVLGAMRRRFV